MILSMHEAMRVRHSCRKYTLSTIDENSVRQLNENIEKYNERSGLNMQLILNNTNAFGGKKSVGGFVNVRNYIAMIGKKRDPAFFEKIGYYGEKLVLRATTLNLGTCWVGDSLERKNFYCTVNDMESFVMLITIGVADTKVGLMEKIAGMGKAKNKAYTELYKADTDNLPDWFINGMKAVENAPSAFNTKPYMFTYENGIVTASYTDNAQYGPIDLGIAKLHFEMGAGKGHFELGLNGKFDYNA